jgi:hypothetical protein
MASKVRIASLQERVNEMNSLSNHMAIDLDKCYSIFTFPDHQEHRLSFLELTREFGKSQAASRK